MAHDSRGWLTGPLCALFLAGCGGGESVHGPLSDDPADWNVDTSVEYRVLTSEPRWAVPGMSLPPEAAIMASNANVDIQFHGDRLFMAWRTAPFHFASDRALMHVVSTRDQGISWEYEALVDLDTDVREPRLLSLGGRLQLIFFEAGTDMFAFEPVRMWRMVRNGAGIWGEREVMVDDGEVPWDVKVRRGRAWMTSYRGEHYQEGGVIEVYFKTSTDGETWKAVDGAPFVYKGGASEAAFEFDSDGSLWAVLRNEDGDATGWGSLLCHAPEDALSHWVCPEESDPERYDSPELFRHGDDLYLAARRDVGGPFGGPGGGSLVDYSFRPKRSALYRIDKAAGRVVHLQDLPGTGDTAFPAVRRTGSHSFLLANYTSPLEDPDITWMLGQTSEKGTSIYLLDLDFIPE